MVTRATTDVNESTRWCHALAIRTLELRRSPTRLVARKSHSLAPIDAKASQAALMSAPCTASCASWWSCTWVWVCEWPWIGRDWIMSMTPWGRTGVMMSIKDPHPIWNPAYSKIADTKNEPSVSTLPNPNGYSSLGFLVLYLTVDKVSTSDTRSPTACTESATRACEWKYSPPANLETAMVTLTPSPIQVIFTPSLAQSLVSYNLAESGSCEWEWPPECEWECAPRWEMGRCGLKKSFTLDHGVFDTGAAGGGVVCECWCWWPAFSTSRPVLKWSRVPAVRNRTGVIILPCTVWAICSSWPYVVEYSSSTETTLPRVSRSNGSDSYFSYNCWSCCTSPRFLASSRFASIACAYTSCSLSMVSWSCVDPTWSPSSSSSATAGVSIACSTSSLYLMISFEYSSSWSISGVEIGRCGISLISRSRSSSSFQDSVSELYSILRCRIRVDTLNCRNFNARATQSSVSLYSRRSWSNTSYASRSCGSSLSTLGKIDSPSVNSGRISFVDGLS
ncbi:hypothetical protein OGAPHI_003251 [Ogataea philodendri]|uniref:Uncharacterized protein n=1 Tax=Ogataea philodendri TaxID=1378263 RepID=A0A9P8P7M3_9ASCO|nr:uncharacterized protein OGAPHI_003251 [Ogataea philodendri]KAH3666802.1 hypothetical protein OGAPHI_003251 [Ogataea philodendri]